MQGAHDFGCAFIRPTSRSEPVNAGDQTNDCGRRAPIGSTGDARLQRRPEASSALRILRRAKGASSGRALRGQRGREDGAHERRHEEIRGARVRAWKNHPEVLPTSLPTQHRDEKKLI